MKNVEESGGVLNVHSADTFSTHHTNPQWEDVEEERGNCVLKFQAAGGIAVIL